MSRKTLDIEKLPFMQADINTLSHNEIRGENVEHDCWQSGYLACLRNVHKQVDEAVKKYNNGWIRVQDKLPEPGQAVLVRVKTKYRVVQKVAEYTINHRWEGVRGNEIAHWQPLPDDPTN